MQFIHRIPSQTTKSVPSEICRYYFEKLFHPFLHIFFQEYFHEYQKNLSWVALEIFPLISSETPPKFPLEILPEISPKIAPKILQQISLEVPQCVSSDMPPGILSENLRNPEISSEFHKFLKGFLLKIFRRFSKKFLHSFFHEFSQAIIITILQEILLRTILK